MSSYFSTYLFSLEHHDPYKWYTMSHNYVPDNVSF
jgi:hypothetical protein